MATTSDGHLDRRFGVAGGVDSRLQQICSQQCRLSSPRMITLDDVTVSIVRSTASRESAIDVASSGADFQRSPRCRENDATWPPGVAITASCQRRSPSLSLLPSLQYMQLFRFKPSFNCFSMLFLLTGTLIHINPKSTAKPCAWH